LMRDFAIAAGQLGQFSAFYFYAYILMQIPTGVFVDRWGARRLLIAGSAGATIGTLLFGGTSSYALASAGRPLGGAPAARRRRVDGRRVGSDPEARDALVSQEPVRDDVRPRAHDGQHRRARRAGAAAAARRAVRLARGRDRLGAVRRRDRRGGGRGGRQRSIR